jgi:arsenite-transporting ATPase
VTIPEDMAIKETERMIKSLDQHGMKVKQMVINNVIPVQVDCPFCQARREEQDKYIGQIREKFSDLKTMIIPLQPQEVKGIESLENFKEVLFQ